MKSDWSRRLTLRAVIELAGRPKEHIEQAMKLLVEDMRQQEDLKIEESEIFDAKKVVEEGEMYTIFAELVVEAKDMIALNKFCFDYTPSSIEIHEPAHIDLDAASATGFLNDLLARLHETDMALKSVRAKHQVLNVNATALLRNFVMMGLREKDKTLEELSDYIGIKPEELKPFLAAMLESKIIAENSNSYHLIK